MVVDPEEARVALVAYLLRTLWALLVIIAALAVAKAVRAATTAALGRQRATPNVTVLLGNLSRLVVYVAAALLVIAIYTGESFGWVLASFSVFTLVVGLSFQDILKSFLAGIYVLVERPFRIGDTVRIEPHEGVVQEIAFRTMQLRTEDGREVVIPNAILMTTPVVNLTRYPQRSATIELSIPAGQAQEDIPDRVRELLGRFDGIAADPTPLVRLRGFSGDRAKYQVVVWGRDREHAAGEAIAAIRASAPEWDVSGV